MSLKKLTFLSGFIIFLMTITFTVSAEEPVVAPLDSTAISSDQQVVPKNTNETQWAWGEVTNLDVLAKTLTLKYLDYETDQEKELVLTVDDMTAFENIKSLDEIKIKDTLSVDYMVSSDGKNIAKNINFEKPDSSTAAITPVVENTKPAAMAEPIITDTSMQQAAAPVETPMQAPVVTQPEVQPGIVAEPSALISQAPVQAVLTPAPATQEGQTQQ
ncbi:MAG: hypothetical protein PHC29_03075 [Candidatus Omnitrophica bacterium]|nr:hypothetical protein [Candidatus Omnitrophota bacterium]